MPKPPVEVRCYHQSWRLVKGLPLPVHHQSHDLSVSVAAASITAKVVRDRQMVEMDRLYPGYGFARHKGYPTEAHLKALAELGPCPEHRRSFGPVAELIDGDLSAD